MNFRAGTGLDTQTISYITIRIMGYKKTRQVVPYQATIPKKIGKHIKIMDIALPGRHTKRIYDSLTRQEAKVLA